MGTKGRDAALWLTFAFATAAMFTGSKAAFLVSLFFAGGFFWHHAWEVPRAGKLDYIVLIPVNRWWAGVLVRNRIKGPWDRAYEIHVRYKNRVNVREQRECVLRDLLYINENKPGLYLWETATSVPSPIKVLIREKSKEGGAFWSRGCLLPRFPMMYKKTGKRLRHGAFLVLRERTG